MIVDKLVQSQIDDRIRLLFKETEDTEFILKEIKKQVPERHWSLSRLTKRIKVIAIEMGLNSSIREVVESYKLDNTKEVYTTTDIQHITRYTIKLLESASSRIDVVKELARYTGKTIYSCHNYYDSALRAIEDETRASIALIRSKRIHGLEKDLKEAHSRYKAAETDKDSQSWFTIYLSIKKQIDSYYPNKLEMKEVILDDDQQSIDISFKVVGQDE